MDNANAIEKIEPSENKKMCGQNGNETEKENPIKLDDLNIKKICRGRCSICASEYMHEIHTLRKGGLQLEKIVTAMKERRNVQFSRSAMSRHFSNLLDRQLEVSSQIVNADLIDEATAKSFHIKRTIELLDLAFNSLIARAKNHNYIFDVNDLEKLMKLRYQTLSGNDDVDKDILGIFQKATDKYGVNLQQGVLFRPRAEQ